MQKPDSNRKYGKISEAVNASHGVWVSPNQIHQMTGASTVYCHQLLNLLFEKNKISRAFKKGAKPYAKNQIFFISKKHSLEKDIYPWIEERNKSFEVLNAKAAGTKKQAEKFARKQQAPLPLFETTKPLVNPMAEGLALIAEGLALIAKGMK